MAPLYKRRTAVECEFSSPEHDYGLASSRVRGIELIRFTLDLDA